MNTKDLSEKIAGIDDYDLVVGSWAKQINTALLEALEVIEFYGDGSKYSPLRNVGIDQGKKARDFLARMNMNMWVN